MWVVRLIAVISVGFLTLPGAAWGSISLSQSLDKQQIAFEDSLTLVLELTWPGPQYAYRFERPLQPDLEDFQIGPFRTAISSQGAGDDEVSTKTFAYTLLPMKPGQARIEPITISYVSYPDSIPGELVSEPMVIQVARPVPPEEVADSIAMQWLVAAALLVLTVIATFVILRMRRSPVSGEAFATPAEEFLDRLHKLKNEAGSNVKQFQTGLYSLLVTYLKKQHHLNLDRLNAEQIGDRVADTDMPKDQQDQIIGWLKRAEREKFAPVAAGPGETTRLATEIQTYFEDNVIQIMRRPNGN